jgi:hypothetical protein
LVKISKEEILKRGYVDVKVQVQGLRQSHRLTVMKEKTQRGTLHFLMAKHYIPTSELVRLAEVFQLPIRHKDKVVFPKGKMPKDFLEQDEKIEVESETIEAEIEE